MPRSSGDTLSLNALAGATGNTQNSNVSLGTIKGSPVGGDLIGLSKFSIDSVGTISGFTYAVESTSENYTLGFTTGSEGLLFNSKIGNRSNNFTWSVPAGSYITLSTNSGATATFAVSSMNPQSPSAQTSLLGVQTHTIRAKFADGFNDHATNYNTNIDKTVYSVDSYDGNSTALCLTIDSPVTLADGTIVEAGDLTEGDTLKGFSIGGLNVDSDGTFLDWSTDSLSTLPKNVTIVNLTYSFASRYYDVNNGEVTATAEHPLLVKDSVSGDYKFKEMFNLVVGDKLIKGNGTEVEITSVEVVEKTTEIISIDVEEEDTYMVNGYITHNKGGNSHTDLAAPGAPTSLAYSSPFVSWVAPSSVGTTGITAYDVQIDNNSDFSSLTYDYSEWSSTSIEVNTLLSAGTWYIRVRAIDQGLKGTWATLTFTR
jgi:hypothetical protein